MSRPPLISEMLDYAPIPLREYVEEVEHHLDELEQREREREGSTGQQRMVDDPTANRLGGFARDSATSRQAALDNYPRSGTQRAKVLQAVIDAGEGGATSEQIAAQHKLHLPSVKPRLTELREGGFVQKSGTRAGLLGSHLDVYTATAKGRLESRHRPHDEERDDVDIPY